MKSINDAHGRPVAIVRVQRVTWHAGDATDIINRATIIGRARVELDGGGLLHGLVIATPPRVLPVRVESRTALSILSDNWPRHVVFWDRYENTFATVPLDEEVTNG